MSEGRSFRRCGIILRQQHGSRDIWRIFLFDEMFLYIVFLPLGRISTTWGPLGILQIMSFH